jgi:hypothetical protein
MSPAYTMENGCVIGNTFHLVIGHVVQMQEFGIVETLKEIGLPMTVNAGLDRYRCISLHCIHVARLTRFFGFHHRCVVVAQLTAFFEKNLVGMASPAFREPVIDTPVFHMA